MNGIIVIDKPENYTSFDVIAVLRKKLHQKKIGHMGTLDPMATGVLPVLLGETARFQIFTPDNDKAYIAEMRFGMTTDTLDSTGKILSETESHVTDEKLREVLGKFKGKIEQIPPMFSAIKKNGQKLCNLARQGVEIERDARKIDIKFLETIDFNYKNQSLRLNVLCSKGTYIRSLCADIGDALGCGAVMTYLRRTLSNGFSENSSVSLEKIIDSSPEEIKKNYILPTEFMFKNQKAVDITTAQALRFKNGGNLFISRLGIEKTCSDNEIYKLYSDNKFVGIGRICKGSEELRFLKCQSFDTE
jgi:tRNA pseudouridine55 synthase